FESKGVLGNGGFGQVDKVLSMTSFKEYARKRVPRSTAFRGPRKEHMKKFIAEIQLLKRLRHHHIVELIGSYTDTRYIGLIMSPVAEMDLGRYLTDCTVSNHPELRTFFGCLATALEYLHEQGVRHKDIKPSNILVDRGTILYTDFGLSFDFTDASGSTTASMVNGMSPRYCAPEVALHEPRNTKSDIWSLGVVFMEIVA
ncbi:kinase-like protein, partial [Lindgomyces ingoldianus]